MTDAEIKRVLEAFLLVTEKSLMMEPVREALGSDVQPADIQRLFL